MDGIPTPAPATSPSDLTDAEAPIAVFRPEDHCLPVVLASPHSGSHYPETFLAQSRLDATALRKSEDTFVDELLIPAARSGAPLLRALFPRAYVDVNREPFELDPRMFAGPLPPYVTTRSPRLAAGLGTIPRIVATGYEIYRDKLDFHEALNRIERCYRPYHAALHALVLETRLRHGQCILVDGHSMPSVNSSASLEPEGQLDIVLGDCHGISCAGWVTATAERVLADRGYTVARNEPYPGGFVTRHYGRPKRGVHALQIEVNRALYMDERHHRRGSFLPILARDLARVVTAISTEALSRS